MKDEIFRLNGRPIATYHVDKGLASINNSFTILNKKELEQFINWLISVSDLMEIQKKVKKL